MIPEAERVRERRRPTDGYTLFSLPSSCWPELQEEVEKIPVIICKRLTVNLPKRSQEVYGYTVSRFSVLEGWLEADHEEENNIHPPLPTLYHLTSSS